MSGLSLTISSEKNIVSRKSSEVRNAHKEYKSLTLIIDRMWPFVKGERMTMVSMIKFACRVFPVSANGHIHDRQTDR